MEDFYQNPLLQGMSPEKLQFLKNFASAKKPTDMKEMTPFLLSALSSARSKNIQFSEAESSLLIGLLKQNMSEADAKKADKIIRLMNSALLSAPKKDGSST